MGWGSKRPLDSRLPPRIDIRVETGRGNEGRKALLIYGLYDIFCLCTSRTHCRINQGGTPMGMTQAERRRKAAAREVVTEVPEKPSHRVGSVGSAVVYRAGRRVPKGVLEQERLAARRAEDQALWAQM